MKLFILLFLLTFTFFELSGQLMEDVEECSKAKINFYGKGNKNQRISERLQYPGDANIDVNYYKLDLNLKYTPNYLKGIVTIKGKITQNGLKNILIDLQNALKVDSVFIETKKVLFTHENAKIDISLPKPLNQNDQFTIMIFYQGKPGSSGYGSFIFGTHGPKNEPAIWSLSEPFGASDWFPCKDNQADKADSSDVWITAPKEFVSVSNGILEQKIEGDSTNTYKWKSRYPISNYLISIALSNYKYYKNDFNYGGTTTMPVEHYVYPEVFTDANKLLMDETLFMLDLFTKKFGPYPFLKERYGHAQFGWGGGMEHQTCTSLSSFSSGLVAHELAHQWFGDKITCQNWENIWLNEGFATFGALVYWEAKLGANNYKTQIINTMKSAKNAKGSVFVQNPVSIGEIFNGSRSYSKGGIVLHMLRNIVGDDKFFNILKDYTASKLAYGNATTEDFQKSAEKISGLDLNYFFSQWIYGENYPKYNFSWKLNPTLNNGNYTLNLKISQKPNTPKPTFFSMPIDIKVIMDDSTKQTIRVFNNKMEQLFDFEFNKKPVRVEFDPENGILKDVELGTLELALGIENENFAKEIKLSISPNPADNELVVSFVLEKPENYNLELFNLKGQAVKQIEAEISGKNIKRAISTQDLPNSIYELKLSINGKIITRKIAIEH